MNIARLARPSPIQPPLYSRPRPSQSTCINASASAACAGSQVTILAVPPVRWRSLTECTTGQADPRVPNRAPPEEGLGAARHEVGTVLVPGARTPRLITARLVATMKRGA